MLAIPARQQIYSYHLTLSLLLLLLTIYPHLFNHGQIGGSVAAYSSHDLYLTHNLIENFDIIHSDDLHWSRSISTRDTSNQLLLDREHNELTDAISKKDKHSTIREVQFDSLGRKFKLILSQPNHLITRDFNVIALDADGKQTPIRYNRDDIGVLEGFVDGEARSRATASLDKRNKLIVAQIKTDHDIFIVEPTHMHRNSLSSSYNETGDNNSTSFITTHSKLYDKTMIVYNLRDHKQFNTNDNDTSQLFRPEKLCSSVNISDYSSPLEDDSNQRNDQDPIYNPDIENIYKLYKRPNGKDKKSTSRRAKRGINIHNDHFERKTRCTLHLVADYLFYKNVGNGDIQTTINYLLALINRINQIYLPTVWESSDEATDKFSNIGFTVQNITIHQEYTRMSNDEMHYNNYTDKAWKAREFLDNFSKYSPPRHYCLAHLLTYRQFDSPVLGLAYVASARSGTIGGICSPTQEKGLFTYKHNTGMSTSRGISGETLITRQADLVLAHELGHNLGAEHDSNECRPRPSNGGAYLMHPFAVMGFEKNNRFLSNCSRLSIGRVIKRKGRTCFVEVVDNVCGNGVVEDGEECDGGDVGFDHSDPCCDSSCRFTPGSQCSDRHSWCCSKCRILPAGFPCRPAEEYNCKQASYCNGQEANCPSSPPVEDDTVCVGRGLCRGGDCRPFCEARELLSCLCSNPVDACKLCCKTTMNGTCVPYDTSAPYLPDGVLCYRGVCEKGRCEQPIQDVVERLWDVIEDINLTTFVKLLRDNIIIVVLIVSIPIWCIITHYINEFDKQVKDDVMTAIAKSQRRREPKYHSPFLPRLFVGDDVSQSNSAEEIERFKDERRVEQYELSAPS